MTGNKKRKPYVRPSMEVIKVETMSILAGSDFNSSAKINQWESTSEEDVLLEDF